MGTVAGIPERKQQAGNAQRRVSVFRKGASEQGWRGGGVRHLRRRRLYPGVADSGFARFTGVFFGNDRTSLLRRSSKKTRAIGWRESGRTLRMRVGCDCGGRCVDAVERGEYGFLDIPTFLQMLE
jgi:hypothetical protein